MILSERKIGQKKLDLTAVDEVSKSMKMKVLNHLSQDVWMRSTVHHNFPGELVLILPPILFLKSILIYYDGNVIYLIIYKKEEAGIYK